MNWSDKYVGLPFKPLGRDFNGVDCWGLKRLVLKEEKGIIVPSYTGFYERADDGEAKIIADKIAMETAMSDWIPVPRGQEREFDGMLISLNGLPCHVGIVVRKNIVLHITEGINATTEDYRTNRWTVPGKIAGFYRHKQLCNMN